MDLLRPDASADEAWIDFELRAADYQTLLAELAAAGPERDAAEGFLPGISRRGSGRSRSMTSTGVFRCAGTSRSGRGSRSSSGE